MKTKKMTRKKKQNRQEEAEIIKRSWRRYVIHLQGRGRFMESKAESTVTVIIVKKKK